MWVLCLKFSSKTQKYSVWEPLRLEFERGGETRGGVEEELHQKVVRVRAGSQHAQSERGQRRPAEVPLIEIAQVLFTHTEIIRARSGPGVRA